MLKWIGHGMVKHWNYGKYVLKHKYYVYKAGVKKYHVNRWQLLIHDLSKFHPNEWFAYAERFFGKGKGLSEQALPEATKEAFHIAWDRHLKRNKHHWQYWLTVYDDGAVVVKEMPKKYANEMLADWSGAGKAQGYSGNPLAWYKTQKRHIVLHPNTTAYIENLLGYKD